MVEHARGYSWWLHTFAVVFGCAMVLVGAFDVIGRVATTVEHFPLSNLLPNQDIGGLAFGPAVAINDPSILNSLRGSALTSASKSAPVMLSIPSIGVKAGIEIVGKKTDGSMDTPKDIQNVAWYAPGSAPGEAGNTVMAGHVNNALSLGGVFAHLTEIKIGDYITVDTKDGDTRVYVVNKINTYPIREAPAAEIFSTEGTSQLVLITCDGDWIGKEHSFDKRFVVVARLIAS